MEGPGVCASAPWCAVPLPDALAEHRAELRWYLDDWAARQEQTLVRFTPQLDAVAVAMVASPEGNAPISPSETKIQSANLPQVLKPTVNSTTTTASQVIMSPWPTGGESPERQSRRPTMQKQNTSFSLSDRDRIESQARVLGFNRPSEHSSRRSVRSSGKLIVERFQVEAHRLLESSAASDRCIALRRFEESRFFHGACSIVILGNAIFLAVAADYRIEHLDDAADWVKFVELGLCVFYTSELVIRCLCHRLQFLFGTDWAWNWFDMLLVAMAIQEQVVEFAHSGGGAANMSYLRVVRLLKMLKLLRVIRLTRVFRELRLVLDSILGSVKSMIWSIVLVIIISFMFGVCFTQGAFEYLQDVNQRSFDESCADCLLGFSDAGGCAALLAGRNASCMIHVGCGECLAIFADDYCDAEGVQASILHYWGSVPVSMLSVFMATTGGIDWWELSDPLSKIGPIYYGIFCFYIAFFIFVVMNSLTSIFVDSVKQYSARDEAQQIHDQMRRKEEYMKKIVKLYESMATKTDNDDAGFVTYETFCEHMNDPEMNAFAASLDIDATDLQQFFNILSDRGRRPVDIETFVVGCIKLRGTAKSMDVIELVSSHRRFANEARAAADEFVLLCEREFTRLHSETCREPQTSQSFPGKQIICETCQRSGIIERCRQPSRWSSKVVKGIDIAADEATKPDAAEERLPVLQKLGSTAAGSDDDEDGRRRELEARFQTFKI